MYTIQTLLPNVFSLAHEIHENTRNKNIVKAFFRGVLCVSWANMLGTEEFKHQIRRQRMRYTSFMNDMLVGLLTTIVWVGIFSPNTLALEKNWIDIGAGIYVITSQHDQTNTVLVTDGKQAALVDTFRNREDAAQVKEFIDRQALEMKYVIVTEYSETRAMNVSMFSVDGTEIFTPLSVEEEEILELGEKRLKILCTPRRLSDDHLSVEIDANILVAGDCIMAARKTPVSYSEHLQTLDALEANAYSTIVPGSGKILADVAAVQTFFDESRHERKYVITRGRDWYEINDDIIVCSNTHERDNNMTMVISGNEVTLIDVGSGGSQSEAKAEGFTRPGGQSDRVKQYIDEHNLIVKNVIITHDHYDHRGNFDMFVTEGVEVFEAHTIKNNQVVTMGDKTFRLFYTQGHTEINEHISVEINGDILVTGDVLCDVAMPRDLLASRDHIEPYIATLEYLRSQQYPLIIPGHGKLFTDNGRINEYLAALYKKR
jgi:glyoxylase-like metal-dependent hydrolase (beta-lactamase superfamily II)